MYPNIDVIALILFGFNGWENVKYKTCAIYNATAIAVLLVVAIVMLISVVV